MPPDPECEVCRGTGEYALGDVWLPCGCFRRLSFGSRPKSGLQWESEAQRARAVAVTVHDVEANRLEFVPHHSE